MTPKEASKEYNRRLKEKQYNAPESLKGKTVMDVIEMPEFKTNLAAYINEQKMARDAYKQTCKRIKEQGKFVARENRPTIDRLVEAGLLENADDFAFEFAKVLNCVSEHRQVIRIYIYQLGMLAYRLTCEQFICEANPDMAELVKISKSQNQN